MPTDTKVQHTPGRCNYCREQSVVSLTWTTSRSSMGRRIAVTVVARACEEHTHCVNWLSLREIHPEAAIARATGEG